jgi:hypothetical protein
MTPPSAVMATAAQMPNFSISRRLYDLPPAGLDRTRRAEVHPWEISRLSCGEKSVTSYFRWSFLRRGNRVPSEEILTQG